VTDGQTDGQTDRQADRHVAVAKTALAFRGRVRAGPSFQLGTLSTRWENQTPIYLIARTDTLTLERRQTRLTTNQPASQSDTTQLKAGNSVARVKINVSDNPTHYGSTPPLQGTPANIRINFISSETRVIVGFFK